MCMSGRGNDMCNDIGFVKCSKCHVYDRRKVRLMDCELCGKVLRLTDLVKKGMKG